MATTLTKYDMLKEYLAESIVDLGDGTIKMALVADTYTPDFLKTGDAIWADVSGDEVASGSGYTTGGETLTTLDVDADRWDADDVPWTTLTKTFKYGVLYLSGTVDSVVNPLIACVTFDSSAITVTAADFEVRWNASGILTFS